MQARWSSGLRRWLLLYRPWFYDCRRGFKPRLGKVLNQKQYWMPQVIHSRWMSSVTISVHPLLGAQRVSDQCSPTGLSKAGGVSTVLWCEHRKDPLGSIENSRGFPNPGFPGTSSCPALESSEFGQYLADADADYVCQFSMSFLNDDRSSVFLVSSGSLFQSRIFLG